MAEFCNCSAGYGNTGRKKDLIKQSRGLFIVPLFANDGTRNEILVSDVVNDAFVKARINSTDPSTRWYPLQNLKNIEDVRADTVFQTFNDGTRNKVRQGNRAFTGFAIQQGSIFAGKLEAFECAKIGVYFIDDCHELVGSIAPDNQSLRPVALEDGSLDITLMKATDAETGMVRVIFDVSVLEKDTTLRVLGGLDFTQYEGLLDVNCTVSAADTDSCVATLTLDYGKFQAPIEVQGLTSSQFVLYNVTDSAVITISSVTETDKGVYEISYPAQTSGDDLRLSLDAEGFEMEPVLFEA